jgi:hypothetical protein
LVNFIIKTFIVIPLRVFVSASSIYITVKCKMMGGGGDTNRRCSGLLAASDRRSPVADGSDRIER